MHSRLDHPNVVKLIGAGYTPRGVRFVVLERLDGGALTQLLGYDNRIRDRRRRFWTRRKISYMDVLSCARSLADALAYCHGRAIPNAMVLHRDLKPDNVGELPGVGRDRTVELPFACVHSERDLSRPFATLAQVSRWMGRSS